MNETFLGDFVREVESLTTHEVELQSDTGEHVPELWSSSSGSRLITLRNNANKYKMMARKKTV